MSAAVTPSAVPAQGASGGGVGVLAGQKNLFIKQTRRGCLQEAMGCEAKNEFLISTVEQRDSFFMYALEDSSFLCRLCCANLRESKMDVKMGNSSASGAQVMSYERPFQCAQVGPCKCCCFQQMGFFNEKREPIGQIKEDFYYCAVPSFTISDNSEKALFKVQMPTCCGGMCVNVCAEGLCNCRIPFYIYPSGTTEPGTELMSENIGEKGEKKAAQITKVWGGLGSEMFTDADKFELLYPAGATPDQKAMLLGSVFFLNMNFFEKQKESGSSGGT